MRFYKRIILIVCIVSVCFSAPYFVMGLMVRSALSNKLDNMGLEGRISTGIFNTTAVIQDEKFQPLSATININHGPIAFKSGKPTLYKYTADIALLLNQKEPLTLLEGHVIGEFKDKITGTIASTESIRRHLEAKGIKWGGLKGSFYTSSVFRMDIKPVSVVASDFSMGSTLIELERYLDNDKEFLGINGAISGIKSELIDNKIDDFMFSLKAIDTKHSTIVNTLSSSAKFIQQLLHTPLKSQNKLILDTLASSQKALSKLMEESGGLESIVQTKVDNKTYYLVLDNKPTEDAKHKLLIGERLTFGENVAANLGIEYVSGSNTIRAKLSGSKQGMQILLQPYAKNLLSFYIKLMMASKVDQETIKQLTVLSLFTSNNVSLNYYIQSLQEDFIAKQWLQPLANQTGFSSIIEVDLEKKRVYFNNNDMADYETLMATFNTLNKGMANEIFKITENVAVTGKG